MICTINIKYKLVKWNIWTNLVMILHSSMYVKWSTCKIKNKKNLDVVMICTCFIIASPLTLIFCLSLLFWVLKIASSLIFFLCTFFCSWMLETTLSLIFILRLSLLAWVLEITSSFIFRLYLFLWMLETSLLLIVICCLLGKINIWKSLTNAITLVLRDSFIFWVKVNNLQLL